MDGAGRCCTGTDAWRIRSVSWKRVLLQQDWGSLLSTVIVLVALAITDAALGGPRTRPFLTYDATISFPNSETTIPYWSVLLASALALLLTVLLAELWLARGVHLDLTDALAASLHFVIDGYSAFGVTGLITQVTKRVVGRPRPDFLDRCQPVVPDPVDVQYGLPATANVACTVPPSGELDEGQYSFPSGHASTAFVFSVWTAGYAIWAFNLRLSRKSAASIRRLSWGQRLMREASTAAGFLYIVGLLGYAWTVGVSRITDFKHHPSDVAAGALLGGMFGVAFVVRSIGRLGCVLEGTPDAEAAYPSTPPPESSLLHGNRVQVHHYGGGNSPV